jgi:hypothetical protein
VGLLRRKKINRLVHPSKRDDSSRILAGEMTLGHAARLVNRTSCWLFILCFVSAAVDIATAQPGRWHLIPNFVEPLLIWSPIFAAVLALTFAISASVRGERGAFRRETWLVSAVITLFYATVYVLNQLFPMRVY